MDSTQKKNTLETVIDPNKGKIPISTEFYKDRKTELKAHKFGWLNSPEKTAYVNLWFNEEDTFMYYGQKVAKTFGFLIPTRVLIEYKQIADENNFYLTIVPPLPSANEPDIIDLSSGDEKHDLENDSDNDNYTLHDLENDRCFGWKMIVSKASASGTKNQVLHLPPSTAMSMGFRNRKTIMIKTPHKGDGIICTINTNNRKKKNGKKEKYLTYGWYDFVKANNLKEGDKLQFQVSDPPEVLVVKIIPRT